VKRVAAQGTSLVVRRADDHSQYVRLKEGIRWPLAQIARGKGFHKKPDGTVVMWNTATTCFEGPGVHTLWSYPNKVEDADLPAGPLYRAGGNNGLNLVSQQPDLWMKTTPPTTVEVLLLHPGGALRVDTPETVSSVGMSQLAHPRRQGDHTPRRSEKHVCAAARFKRPDILEVRTKRCLGSTAEPTQL